MCIAINYTPLSMAYYTDNSTDSFLSFGPTALICISKEWCCKEELHVHVRVRDVGNFEQ